MIIEKILPNGVVVARELRGLCIHHNFASMADYLRFVDQNFMVPQ